MQFEWDESKRKSNLRKHGIDFTDCLSVFYGLTVTLEDARGVYAAVRYKTIGFLRGRFVSSFILNVGM